MKNCGTELMRVHKFSCNFLFKIFTWLALSTGIDVSRLILIYFVDNTLNLCLLLFSIWFVVYIFRVSFMLNYFARVECIALSPNILALNGVLVFESPL